MEDRHFILQGQYDSCWWIVDRRSQCNSSNCIYAVCLEYSVLISVASFTKEVNQRLAKRPLVLEWHLANRRLTSLVKKATDGLASQPSYWSIVLNKWDPQTLLITSNRRIQFMARKDFLLMNIELTSDTEWMNSCCNHSFLFYVFGIQ